MSSTKVRCANLKLDGWHTKKFCCQFSWKWGREVNDDIKFYGDIVLNSSSTSVGFVFLFDFSSRTNAKRTKWTTASRLHLLKNLYCTHALKWPLSPIHNPMPSTTTFGCPYRVPLSPAMLGSLARFGVTRHRQYKNPHQAIQKQVEEVIAMDSTDPGIFYCLLFLMFEYSFKYIKSVDSFSLILVKSNDKLDSPKVCT